MADQVQPSNSNSSDEIDLGQLLQLIKRGFQNLGNFFLRVFIYLRSNGIKLIGLVVLGLAISFGLNQIISKKLKTDVIVRPNFESKNYLYDAVDEVSANIKAKNESFFSSIDISTADLEGLKIEVEAISDEDVKTEDNVVNEMKYLEVLQNFKDESFVIDILRSELSEKSVIDHRITFEYKDADAGPIVVGKLMNYLNDNTYFDELKKVSENNAKIRVQENTRLIGQIDQLVDNYSKAILTDRPSGNTSIYMEKEKTLNVPALLNLKNQLLKEIEDKKMEIIQQTQVLSILNFGKTQEVKRSIFAQTYFLIPAILVTGFMLLSFFKYLNRKAKEIE